MPPNMLQGAKCLLRLSSLNDLRSVSVRLAYACWVHLLAFSILSCRVLNRSVQVGDDSAKICKARFKAEVGRREMFFRDFRRQAL